MRARALIEKEILNIARLASHAEILTELQAWIAAHPPAEVAYALQFVRRRPNSPMIELWRQWLPQDPCPNAPPW
jgi:hypothetical protein